MDKLLECLIEVDDLLTENRQRAERHAEWLEANEPNWRDVFLEDGVPFYLADGGYSRLVVLEDSGLAVLTYNSTKKVKSRFDLSHDKIIQLQKAIDLELQKRGD